MNKSLFTIILLLLLVADTLSLKQLSYHDIYDPNVDSHLSIQSANHYHHNQEYKFNNIYQEIPSTVDDCPKDQVLDYQTLQCFVRDPQQNSWVRQSNQGADVEASANVEPTKSGQSQSNSISPTSSKPSKAPIIIAFILSVLMILISCLSDDVTGLVGVIESIILLIQLIIIAKDGNCKATKVLGGIAIAIAIIYSIISIKQQKKYSYVLIPILSVVQLIMQILILKNPCS